MRLDGRSLVERAPIRGRRSPRARRTWFPLLTGALRDQALTTIDKIAGALDHAPRAITGKQKAAAAHSWSLGSGAPGVALFYAYLSKARRRASARARSEQFLNHAIAAMSHEAMGPSLIDGFTGIAWTHLHIHRLFTDTDVAGVDDIDAALLTLLEQRQLPADFELLYGLAGLGVFALEQRSHPEGRAIARLIVDRLDESSERSGPGVAWVTPADAMLQMPDGAFCLGMAHGIPGVIGFLARAVAAGIAVEKAGGMLEDAVTWLSFQRLPEARGGGFPAWRTGNDASPPPARLAWCYGDPGVAASLFAAGEVMRRPDWQHEAVRLVLAAGARTPEQNRVIDATLCHGAAGVAHICNRLYQATGEPRLAAMARHWFTRTLNEFCQPGGGVAFLDSGFLNGAAGIGLALLAAVTPIEPQWDRLLLLDTIATGPARRRHTLESRRRRGGAGADQLSRSPSRWDA